MKILLGTLIFFFVLQQSNAQQLDSLHQKMLGNWELNKYLSTNNGTGNESPDIIKQIKTFRKSNYTLNLFEVKSGREISRIIGNYKLFLAPLKESNYEETITSSKMDTSLTKTVKKTVSIDEADRLIFVWTERFITYTEIWSRSIEKDSPKKAVPNNH